MIMNDDVTKSELTGPIDLRLWDEVRVVRKWKIHVTYVGIPIHWNDFTNFCSSYHYQQRHATFTLPSQIQENCQASSIFNLVLEFNAYSRLQVLPHYRSGFEGPANPPCKTEQNDFLLVAALINKTKHDLHLIPSVRQTHKSKKKIKIMPWHFYLTCHKSI